MSAVRTEDYEQFRKMVNMCLRPTGKELLGFNERGHLIVRGTSQDGKPFEHSVDELSSGERQMLFLLGFVIAFLRPGGIAIVDEPDLHIHSAMTTQVIQMLDNVVVKQRAGQLIMASHSEHVWDYFSRSSEHIELSPWRGTGK
jgi:ABC-type lipoprotein export system ATPase subunit